MLRNTIKSTGTLMLLSLTIFSQTHIKTPIKGQVVTPEACAIEVKTTHAVDSLVVAIEYVSKKGILRKKQLSVFTEPPYTTAIPVADIPEQFAQGATVVAELYRKDDTLEVVKTTHLYLQKSSVPQDKFISPEKAIALLSNDAKTSGQITIRPQNKSIIFVAKIKTPSDKKAKLLSKQLSFMVGLDPQLSQSSHPTNSTSIIHIVPNGPSQLISHSISQDEFTVNQTQTALNVATRIRTKGTFVYATIEVPSYLLGAPTPDQWLVNFVVQQNSQELLSLYEGDLSRQVAPRLMPILTRK